MTAGPIEMRPRPTPASPSTATAALAGAAAGALGLGVSELVAGLVPGGASLVAAVGQLIIDLQPPGAKDLVVGLFGTNDKLALEAAVVLVALLASAALGLVARRSLALAAAGFAGFGVLGFAATLGERSRRPLPHSYFSCAEHPSLPRRPIPRDATSCCDRAQSVPPRSSPATPGARCSIAPSPSRPGRASPTRRRRSPSHPSRPPRTSRRPSLGWRPS